MSDWINAKPDLRRTLNDGDTDKLYHRKAVFGQVNGTNADFKTLEKRRVTNLTTATAPLGVYVNGVIAAVTTDDLEVGQFTLGTPPTGGDIVEATYYVQFFLDSELDGFLADSSEWLGNNGDPLLTQEGLRPASLQYSAYLAYQKLAMRFHENLSTTYRLEDAPTEGNIKYLEWLNSMADGFLKRATSLRQNFYARNDQASAPLYAVAIGAVPRNVPNR